jgi:hypothetical protein
MTRPAAPVRPVRNSSPRAVRNKKRTPARLTAHIEYQPAGLNAFHRRVREAYHAIADQAVKVGFITRRPGTALCGAAGPWADIPDGLFPPLVSCRVCQAITAREHISITGGMP